MKLNLNCILSILFTFQIFAFADVNSEVIWFQHQRPPWMISTGIHKNEGYGDKIRIDIEKKLPQYTHKQLEINPSRLLKQINKHTNICYGPVGKFPILLDKFYWSKPLYLMTGYRIIMMKKTHQKLNQVDEISMNTLIQNKDYTFGKIKGMFHYPVDFEKYKNQLNIHAISSSAPLTHLLRMMRKDRIDWVYDHPVFVKWENVIENNLQRIKTNLNLLRILLVLKMNLEKKLSRLSILR